MAAMNEDQSMAVPASFLTLYLGARRHPAPGEGARIAKRHEFCEDLAAACVETARAMLHDLGVAETDVLERVHQGLCEPGAGLELAEAWWVARRLAELLDWPLPPCLAELPAPSLVDHRRTP